MNKLPSTITLKTIVLSVLLLHGAICSQSQTYREPGLRNNTPEVFALTDARIVIRPGLIQENASMIIRNGIVESVGQNLTIPDDAWQIDMSGKTIYPGFVESYTQMGMPDAKTIAGSAEKLPHHGRHWNPQVRSHFTSSSAYSFDENKAADLRAKGFVVAHTISDAGVFRGSGTVVKLAEILPPKQLIRTDMSQGLSFQRSSDLAQGYPTSVMGAIALIRQSFYDAIWYDKIRSDLVSKNELNPSIGALATALNNNTPFLIETPDEQYLLRAADIAREFGLNLWVVGSGAEYRRLDRVKNSGLELILPLNFPEDPDLRKPEESINLSLEDLRHWYLAPGNPASMYREDIPFAFTSFGTEKPSDFLKNLRKAVERGLPEEKALEALTTLPAKRLGIDPLYGSLENGRSASFIITNGNIFDKEAQIEEVWVGGKQHKIQQNDHHLAGEWLLTGGSLDNKVLALQSGNNRLQGEIKDKQQETKVRLENVRYENNRISFRLPKDSLRVGMLLSASVAADEMLGFGEISTGGFFHWRANKKGSERPVPNDNNDSKTLKALNLPQLFPSMEFGIERKPEQPSVLMVRNATLWTQGPQGIMQNADMLIRNGVISQIGENLAVPANAMIIDAESRHVTPGLIDPHLHTSIAGGVNEMGDAITSETRISDVIDANNVWLYRLLAGGLTTANLFHGSANPIGGQSAVIKIRWGGLADDLWLKDAKPGLKFALGENVKRRPDRYPNTRMGTAQIIEDSFLAALQYEKDKAASQGRRPRDAKPFRRDLQLEPILEVLQGKRLAHVHAYRQDEMIMMMRLAEEYGFTIASFEHTVEGYKIAEELRDHGAAAIVWTDWSSFKVEAYDAIHQNAKLLLDAGVLTSLHSDNTQLATRMNWEAGKVLPSGVSEEQAMSLITLYPAQILRLDDRIGSLEIGKDADFVIWNGHPLSSFTTADQTWIEGRKYFDKEHDRELQQKVKDERTLIMQRVLDSK